MTEEHKELNEELLALARIVARLLPATDPQGKAYEWQAEARDNNYKGAQIKCSLGVAVLIVPASDNRYRLSVDWQELENHRLRLPQSPTRRISAGKPARTIAREIASYILTNDFREIIRIARERRAENRATLAQVSTVSRKLTELSNGCIVEMQSNSPTDTTRYLNNRPSCGFFLRQSYVSKDSCTIDLTSLPHDLALRIAEAIGKWSQEREAKKP